MKTSILLDPSCGTANMGDYIISNAAEREVAEIINGDFVIHVSTHSPVTHFYQNIKKRHYIKIFMNAKYKLLLGSNVINPNMFTPFSQWNVNIFNYKPLRETILVGVGLNGHRKHVNLYTRLLFKKILNKDFIHSVRDEATKNYFDKIGIRTINTGCPTMWMLTKDFCKTIPKYKGKNVVFTLTDYCQDREKDQILINTLNNNYDKVYFWVQGANDYDYLKSLNNTERIIIIPPSLVEYEKVLMDKDIDYVGTRLHAGVYAMRHSVRSIILSVDNRVRDMKKTYNLVSLERDEIEKLDGMINGEFATDIRIDEKAINKWKAQFK